MLFSDFLELLLSLLELLLLDPVEGLQFTLQIVEVSVLIDVRLLQSSKFLLQPLVLFHESWLDGDQIAIPLLTPLELSSFLLQFLLQLLLLVLHIGHILGHLSGVLFLLLHDGLNAGLYIGLIVAVTHSIHALQKLQSLGSDLAQLWLAGNRVV